MSWRFLIAILAMGAAAAAWGGLKLGEWLVAHGPSAPAVATHPELDQTPVLDVDGKPFTARPPQPLVNGRLGVPDPPTDVAWKIERQTGKGLASNTLIDVSSTPISVAEARILTEEGGHRIRGIADVGDLMGGGGGSGGARAPLQPIEMAPAPPPPPPVARSSNRGWQASLAQELNACSAKGFFDRPSCAWAARNKYCEPNNAWGKNPNCPAKSF